MESQLSERKREILRRLVEEYVETGQPVGSKGLVERSKMTVSPSTVRNELAELELLGLLAHPHTSAGRVPTERGYRLYADELLEKLGPRSARFPLDLATSRREIESALQATTEMLSDVTRLLALVTAPPLETATVRHVEVLLLQPALVMVVTITSTGGVAKRMFTFPEPVDPGLVKWAHEYLNDRLSGVQLGSTDLRRRVADASLSPVELGFLDVLRPAFVDLQQSAGQRLYVGGAASLLVRVRGEELDACRRLLGALEQRAAALELMGDAFGPRRLFVRVGGELANPALRGVSLVGATYGLTQRTLGVVGLLGPLRMDYDKAIHTVRAAAHELSRFVEGVYGDN